MATARHLKALLESHLQADDERFYAVAMQAAAHEAKLGRTQFANELRSLIDAAKGRAVELRTSAPPVPISRPRGELSGLLAVSYPKMRLADMVLDDRLSKQLHRVIKEQRHAARILEHGLAPRRKLLLVGAPGTGKTMTAAVLAGELGLPLFLVRLDGLLTKFMGETAVKLRAIFDATAETRGVYFFDEFDAIGSQRGLTNDVGEIRRILNSFLQMLDQDRSNGLIVAATNHPEILDHALLRRFDDVLYYPLPNAAAVTALLKRRLAHLLGRGISWMKLARAASGLSYAEVSRAAEDVQKEALMAHETRVTPSTIVRVLTERQEISGRLAKKK